MGHWLFAFCSGLSRYSCFTFLFYCIFVRMLILDMISNLEYFYFNQLNVSQCNISFLMHSIVNFFCSKLFFSFFEECLPVSLLQIFARLSLLITATLWSQNVQETSIYLVVVIVVTQMLTKRQGPPNGPRRPRLNLKRDRKLHSVTALKTVALTTRIMFLWLSLEKGRGCIDIALSQCLWVSESSQVAMTLHLFIVNWDWKKQRLQWHCT